MSAGESDMKLKQHLCPSNKTHRGLLVGEILQDVHCSGAWLGPEEFQRVG